MSNFINSSGIISGDWFHYSKDIIIKRISKTEIKIRVIIPKKATEHKGKCFLAKGKTQRIASMQMCYVDFDIKVNDTPLIFFNTVKFKYVTNGLNRYVASLGMTKRKQAIYSI